MIYIGDVLQLIDDEPEYPGDAPPALMAMFAEVLRNQDADHLLYMMRATVRQTKARIRERLEEMADERQSLMITRYPSLGTNATGPDRF